MIPVPHTYAEWINLLACFTQRENDEEVLLAMQSGTLEWQSGVAERFSKKLIDSVNERMNLASDRFQQAISKSHGEESGKRSKTRRSDTVPILRYDIRSLFI